MHIQIQRLGDLARDCTGHAVAAPGDDSHGDAVWRDIFGDGGAGEITIPRCAHLVRCGQVEPELKTFHHTLDLFGQFGVDHAAPGAHPLHPAVFQQAFVSGAVAVAHPPRQHISYCLKAAMWMVGETRDVIVRVIAAERVQHQKGIEAALQLAG